MIHTIRVKTTVGQDVVADAVSHELKNRLKITDVEKVETTRVFRLEGITKKEAELLAQKLLCEEVNQFYTINKPLLNGSSHVFEIAYKPGVMNPEVASIMKAAKDLGIDMVAADSSREYGFYGSLSKKTLQSVIDQLNLFNKTVEHIVKAERETLKITGTVGPTIIIPIQTMTDEKFMALSKDKLFLNLEEMKIIQSYFKKIQKDPTDCELETLAQTWSEHCAHKTFKAALTVDGKEKQPLFTRLKKEALKHDKLIVSAFVDNSGVMEFYDGFSICGKVETHNSPSAIEPYGGAATGSGGVFRDVVGTGKSAKTIASTDIFCFAHPDMDKKLLPSGCLPPDYLLKRVVTGVKDYGNRMGIPTNNGSIHFHNDFRARPTVIVGAYGILPTKFAQKGQAKKGDLVIAMGGRTGRDGIHGATFSSAEMTDQTITVNSSAVQIGNAIEEKRVFDAILEARDSLLIHAIQDCGAGGFSSAIGEMGSEIGVRVDLSKAALKYEGLAPWEIWISESQERMVLALPKKNLKKLLAICKKYNVETAVLGVFDGSKKLTVIYGRKIVCRLEMDFLHNGLPRRHMIARQPAVEKQEKLEEPPCPRTEKQWIHALTRVLSHGNVCSKEPIVRLYDHSVQGTNDLQPFSGEQMDGPNDAVVLRPFLHKPYGMVISHGLNPILNRIDPYWGSIWAGVEALSNYVAVGGNFKEASLVNNYIWPFPDAESLWSLDRSVEAVIDLMKTFKIPVISGKDSLSSTYRGKDGTVIKIPPVLCMSVFGRIQNASRTCSADIKQVGSTLVLVGTLDAAMGGSVYFDTHQTTGTTVAKPNMALLPKLFTILQRAIEKKYILSTHDISEGGLITTLFEMCVGADMGAEINLKKLGKTRLDYILFNETTGCFVVEVSDEKTAHQLFKDIPHTILGRSKKEKVLSVSQGKESVFRAELDVLKTAWKKPMEVLFP